MRKVGWFISLGEDYNPVVEDPIHLLHPPYTLDNYNAQGLISGSELRKHRKLFPKFAEYGRKTFFDDDNMAFLKYKVWNGTYILVGGWIPKEHHMIENIPWMDWVIYLVYEITTSKN